MATPTLSGVTLRPAPVIGSIAPFPGAGWNLATGTWHIRIAVTDDTAAGSASLSAWSNEMSVTLAAGQIPLILYTGHASHSGGGIVAWISQTDGDAHAGASMAVVQTTLVPVAVAATGAGVVVLGFINGLSLVDPWFPDGSRSTGVPSGQLDITGGTDPDRVTWQDVVAELGVLGLQDFVHHEPGADAFQRGGALTFHGSLRITGGFFQMWDELVVSHSLGITGGDVKCGEKLADGTRRTGPTIVQMEPDDHGGSVLAWAATLEVYDTKFLDGFQWQDPSFSGTAWDRPFVAQASNGILFSTSTSASVFEAVTFEGFGLVDWDAVVAVTLKDIRSVRCNRTSIRLDAVGLQIEDGAFDPSAIPSDADGHLDVRDLRIVSRNGDFDLDLNQNLTAVAVPADSHVGYRFTDPIFEETGDDNDPRVRLTATFNTGLPGGRIASLRMVNTVNLLLLYSTGLPVTGATVEVSRDSDGVVLFSVTTAATGRIAEQVVIRKQYIAGWNAATWAANGNEVTDSISALVTLGALVETGNTPMTMRIRLATWETIVLPITLEKPMQETLVLLPSRMDRMIVREEGEVEVVREVAEVEVSPHVEERIVLVEKKEVTVV